MSKCKENWTVMGYTLLGILAIIAWPITLVMGIAYIITKLCGSIFYW